MPRIVVFRVEYDPDPRIRWGTAQYFQDGVLEGFVTLRIRGISLIEHYPLGMNASVVSLLRSCFRDHQATTEEGSRSARWPMFFCSGNLRNRCGVVKDFSVHHEQGHVVFSQFYGCACPADTVIALPWRAWAIPVAEKATAVLRRCPRIKKGIATRNMGRYSALRDELARLSKGLRSRIGDPRPTTVARPKA